MMVMLARRHSRKILIVMSLLAVLAGIISYLQKSPTDASAPPAAPAPAEAATQAVRPVEVPAPTTAEGYQKLWASIDPSYWAAADVSLSVPMSDGRVVWLYGDTLSGLRGMVNSTGIVQTGGRLHVSHDGMQLLPSGGTDPQGRKVVYWIEEARAVSGTDIEVTAAPIWTGTKNNLDFGRANERSRTALVRLDADGDLTFVSWTGWVDAPVMDTRFLDVADGAPYQKLGHVFYSKRTHAWARLTSGKTLTTICQNRTEPELIDGKLNYAAYRPIFMEV